MVSSNAVIIGRGIQCAFCLVFPLLALSAQARPASVRYLLQYTTPGDSFVQISLEFEPAIPAPAVFVIPRTYPGGYSLVPYDSFVEHASARSAREKPLSMKKEADGPRWDIGGRGESVSRIEYRVNIVRMEQELLSAVDSSKVRPRYLGALGYSVFGYVDGLEDRPINLQLEGPHDWPVLTTLAPASSSANQATAQAENYYALADSEVLMGPDLQVRRLPGKIPLVLAVYAEGDEDLALEGQLARAALDKVQAYFGTIPLQQYTVQLELLRPLPGHEYDFSQEHLDSGTFSLSVARAITKTSSNLARQAALFNYAHHMAHCWIPKRAYGVGYMPFTWEMPPVIDTIWFNEGFGRYAAIAALADALPIEEGNAFRETHLAGLRNVLAEAPHFIQAMPLLVLSREASFMYERDFRIGQNVFARGALMAAEIDDRIRKRTHGKKSLRDALLYLLQRNQALPEPFKTDELPGMLSESTGVDVHDIFDRWMLPNPVPQATSSRVESIKAVPLREAQF
jgi:predicted metalloprotease with PDZ domain